MKKFKGMLMGIMFLTIATPQMVYADVPAWQEVVAESRESTLLEKDEVTSKNILNDTARGIRLSTAMLSITTEQDGTLHIVVDTFTHKDVDRIYEVVFLDMWDEKKEDWVQIEDWSFEKSKEETDDGKLSSYRVSFLVTGCELNHYYRARAMHLVEWDGDQMEGKATETDGVLLTDHEV